MKFFSWILEHLGVKQQLTNDLSAIIATIMALVTIHEEEVKGGGKGSAKKAAVMADLMASFDQPGGIELPAWSKSVASLLFPFLIDLIVDWANGHKPGND